MKIRSIGFGLLVVAGIFLMVSCSGKGFTNRTTIKCIFMVSPQQIKMYNDIVSAFTRKYPQYKVIPEYYTGKSYDRRVKDLFLANNTPDLVELEDFYSYARKGALMDLSVFTAQDPEMAWENFIPATKNIGEFRATQVGFPVSLDTRVFYVNKAKFKKAGLKVPYGGWTMAEFIKAARNMTRILETDMTNSEYGFSIEPNLDELIPYFWSAGADVEDSEGKFSFLNPKINEVLQLFVDLRLRDQYMSPMVKVMTAGQVIPFLKAKIGMIAGGHSYALENLIGSEIDWDIVPLPSIGDPAALVQGRVCTIPKNARNKFGAWRLLRFMVLEEGAQIRLMAGDGIPALKSLAYSSAFSNWGGRGTHNDVFLRQLEYGQPDRLHQQTQNSGVLEKINMQIESLFQGRTNVSATMEEIDKIFVAAKKQEGRKR